MSIAWVPGVLALFAQTTPPGGEIKVPLARYESMLQVLEAREKPELPDVSWGVVERRIEGRFEKGLFRGVLTTEIEVLGARGHQRLPVIDARASLGRVELDGRRTSLLAEGGLYTAGIDGPGRHRLRVELYVGREQDRYARRVQLKLPAVGGTAVDLLVPEQDIEARLAHGALVASTPSGSGTRLVGHVDASGVLDVSWVRRLSHKREAAARTEAQLSGVLTVQETLVSGLAVFDVTVAEGEIDRVDLTLPEGVEVTGVEGDAVLQWQTEAGPRSQLVVLLRYLVEDHLRIGVRFQFPADPGKPIDVKLPSTLADTALVGAVGIQAPAGLEVKVEEVESADVLTARDIPAELSDLSSSPLIHAFRFRASPRVKLSVTRRAEVELTSTIVDEIQASTVLIETGREITKLKLRIRNNTRQHLTMWLPEGAALTHSLVDGQPVRPAISGEGDSEALLLPLRQSERIGEGRLRNHVVREGETLSDIANIYYSDPTAWSRILTANEAQLGGPEDVTAGQSLEIPAREGTTVEESSFVIELAYERARRALSRFGMAETELPRIDVDTVGVTWHLYLPANIEPILFRGNLTQYSSLRYDPFRRVRDFIDFALGVDRAWAGEGYKSILSQRRVIWQAESEQKSGAGAVLSSFPLVGDRYRFKRLLLGTETPVIGFAFVRRGVEGFVRLAAFLGALGLGLAWFWRRPKASSVVLAAAVMLGLLVIGHFILGVHRRLLWGFDLALLITLVASERQRIGARFARFAAAPFAEERLTLRTFAVLLATYVALEAVLSYPLFLSSALCVLLLSLHWLRRREPRQEARHA